MPDPKLTSLHSPPGTTATRRRAPGLLLSAAIVALALLTLPIVAEALAWFVNGMRWFCFRVH